MHDDWPQVIKDVGFDFSWDERKVWKLDVPVTDMAIHELTWHFDIPFLWEHGEVYNLKPQAVLDNPEIHPEQYERMRSADVAYPIDIMDNKGRWVILDGLHRLMRLAHEGVDTVQVRIVPRSRISDIRK